VPNAPRRAASAAVRPSRSTIWVTDVGTYTDPAHSPTIDTSRYKELSHVRRAYLGENSFAKADRIVGRVTSRFSCHTFDSWTPYWMNVTSNAGVPPTANIQRQPYCAPMK